MHDPIGFLAVGSPALVENKRFPHPNPFEVGVDDLVPASGLPEPGRRGPVGSSPGGVLLVFVAKEVPVILWGGAYLALFCNSISRNNISNHIFLTPFEVLIRFTASLVNAYKDSGILIITLYIPWFELIEINVTDDVEVDLLIGHLLPQVVMQELLFGRVESEARWHPGLSVHRQAHVSGHDEDQVPIDQ